MGHARSEPEKTKSGTIGEFKNLKYAVSSMCGISFV